MFEIIRRRRARALNAISRRCASSTLVHPSPVVVLGFVHNVVRVR